MSSTTRTPTSTMDPAAVTLVWSPSSNVLLLLLPHVGLAVVMLALLCLDFVLYRRRLRFLQKRAFDKQELMNIFPKRVIGGLRRSLPKNTNASPRRPGTNQAARDAPPPDKPSRDTTDNSGSSSPADVGQRKSGKRKQKLLESLKSASMVRPDSTQPERRASGDVTLPAKRRLEKREACRKLPPIPDIRSENGSVLTGESRLSALEDEGAKEASSTA